MRKEKLLSQLKANLKNKTPERKAAEEAAERNYKAKQDEKRNFVSKFFDMKCGPLHLEWAIDAYWGRVVKEVLRPNIVAIHTELVKRGITENKKIRFNDADDTMYYIPQEDKGVFVHTGQSRDYLYVFKENSCRATLHIRRIWREMRVKDLYPKPSDMLKDITTALDNVETLSEYADTDAYYVQRPGLQFYKDINFAIPSGQKDVLVGKNKSPRRTYGDFRDSGCILSYEEYIPFEGSKIEEPPPRVEGSVYSFKNIQLLATCLIPCVARELEIDFKELKGYEIPR